MPIQTFAPSVAPDLGSGLSPTIRRAPITYHAGYDEVRHMARHAPAIARLSWSAVTEAVWEYIESFFVSQLRGTSGPFLWTPFDPVPSPTGCWPVMEQFAGGSLGARTCHAKFSWTGGSFADTLPSQYASLAVSANYYLRVRVPPIPAGAIGFKVFADEDATTTFVWQASVVSGLEYWEQSGPFETLTTNPATENTLDAERKWMLVDGPTVIRSPQSPLLYDIEATIVEQLF